MYPTGTCHPKDDGSEDAAADYEGSPLCKTFQHHATVFPEPLMSPYSMSYQPDGTEIV